jgi:outer membrane protein assembly factor BamB
MTFRSFALAIFITLAGSLARPTACAEAPAPTAGNPPLGSPDFRPSPDRPVGWRGDGTGRFPAANPPTQWGRTITGFYAKLRCQGGRPQGPSAAGEWLNMGSLRDWLILGPFEIRDFMTGLEEEILAGETTVQPKAGDRRGDKTWTHWHVSVGNQSRSDGKLLLDLAQAYGKTEQQEWQNHPGTMPPLAAYAQTGLWSPAAGKLRLRIDGESNRKAWFNGQAVKMPGQYEPSPIVAVRQGWNNLVVKAASTKRGWNFAALMTPLPPYEYETKNIAWMTPMPGKSWCSPIVVGDRLFVSADGATLVCLNKADGKTLWMRSTTYYHAVDAGERAKFADLAPKVRQLDAICAALPAMINAAISPDGMKADRDEALHGKIKEKCELEWSIQKEMAKTNRKKYLAWDNDQDWSKFNPVSDGRYVWAAFWGGNKGLGANVVACFDLDGHRVWSHFCGQTGISEHGTHCSPALCGDILIFKTGEILFGFEKMTGKVVWQKEIGGGLGASPLAVKIGAETLVYVPQAGLFRPSDGTTLWTATVTTGIPTPVISDGMIYGVDKQYFVLRLPGRISDSMPLVPAVNVRWEDIAYHMPGTFTDGIIGSPLFDKGLLYVVSQGGALNVVNAETGKPVYARPLDTLNPRLTWVFKVGICSSATLGGQYIFIRDDQGQTIVLQPGPQYRQVAKNLLVEFDREGSQSESQSNFFFEGTRLYFRSREFLYCIGEQAANGR